MENNEKNLLIEKAKDDLDMLIENYRCFSFFRGENDYLKILIEYFSLSHLALEKSGNCPEKVTIYKTRLASTRDLLELFEAYLNNDQEPYILIDRMRQKILEC